MFSSTRMNLPERSGMSKRIVVCDSGPLIALASLGQLDLLRQIYDRVLVPPAVIREVVAQGGRRPGARRREELTEYLGYAIGMRPRVKDQDYGCQPGNR